MLGLCVRAHPPQPAAQNYTHTHIHTYTIHEYRCLAIYACLVYACGHGPLNLQHRITCTHTYIHTQYTNTNALPFMYAWSMHEGTAPSTCSTALHAHAHTYIHNTRIQMPCHSCMLGLCTRALPHQPAAHNYTHTHIHTQYTNTGALPFMHAWSMREGTAPSTWST